jgi:predicted phosphodiesterase
MTKTDLAKIDRTLWRTPEELREELGYQDSSPLFKLVKLHDIPTLGNPLSRPKDGTPGYLIHHDRLVVVPTIMKRFISNDDVEKYNKELHVSGDWMLTGDWHSPFYDVDLIEKLLAIADRFGIKQIVIAGDFGDLHAFSPFKDGGRDWKWEKAKLRNLIKVLIGNFKKVIWLMGNHDLRFWKQLQGMGAEDDIFELVIQAETTNKIQYSTYPYAIINESWMITHPASYSRLQTRNSFFLSSKYMPKLMEKGQSPNGRYGFISYHGHQGGTGFDPSGMVETVDGMGMFEPAKVRYRTMRITTHPEWQAGFMMLRKNFLYRFPKHTTDWDFWLEGK